MTPPKIENPKFFNLLKKKRIMPDDFIDDLLEELDGNALDVLATLIQSRVGTKRQLCQLWCDSIGIAHVDLEKSLFQAEVVRKLPERMARQLYAIPVYKMGDTITVATATPDNADIKKEIQNSIGSPVNLVFALPQDIEWAIENEYRINSNLFEFFSKIKTSLIFQQHLPITEKMLTEIAGKEAINQLHVSLVLYGITENAIEIHISPKETSAKVYFISHESPQKRIVLDKTVYEKLALKLKQLAKTDLLPSDQSHYSRIIFPTPGKKIDIQFKSTPAEFGEKFRLKLMDRRSFQNAPLLNELYFSLNNIKKINAAISAQQGMILISGLPKSGKTYLAYSILRELRSQRLHIMTVEDTVKRLLKDIDQYQTNPKAGFKRADALSSCIKVHPKVIFIQQMEDPEIIETVRKGAEAENIFFIGGIEARDVFEALEKSNHLGLLPIVSCVINLDCLQRLCEHCKEAYPLLPPEIDNLFAWDQTTDVTVYRESGCPYCRQSGFFNLIGIQEVLAVDNIIKTLIRSHAPLKQIQEASAHLGFQSKHYDGIKKVLRGLTTFNELVKSSSQ
jgi:type IV pilus assembly protein PilB